MAGEANEESLRKGQAVNTEEEREQRLEDGGRNEQKVCNVEDRRGDEREGAGYGKQRDTEKEAERKSTGDAKEKH